MATTEYRTCPLCEATCGLELTVEDGKVTKIRGDADDVMSAGFICPKGANLAALHEDPDRLTTPMMRNAEGVLEPCSWDEAFAFIDERFEAIDAEHGRQAFSAYLGNPVAHSLSGLIYGRPMLKAIGTRNVFSASSVDQAPKQVACGLMYGTSLSITIPDIDRTDYLLILGADPLVSNGSLMTAPDFRGRIKKLRDRGGKVVVVDPRRSRTAEAADEHLFIRPGGDALFCFALVNTLFDEGLVAPGDHLDGLLAGLEQVEAAALPFTPEAVAPSCGIDADTIRRIAREVAAAPSAAVYGRIGTTTQPFGTLTSWLIDLISILTGNLDRPGGVMFPKPPAGTPNTQGEPGSGRGLKIHRWASRTKQRGEVLGELPVNCLADEILTPGEGQIRSLITIGGNPVLSTPNGDRLAEALDTLDLMISIDIYRNETSRHAHVILPAPSALEHSHFDLVFTVFSVRNYANFSPPVFPLPDGMLDEWEVLLRLTAIASGAGADADIAPIDDFFALELAGRETRSSSSPVSGRDPAELVAAVGELRGPERLLDIMLRCGPYGDGFGANPGGLSLAKLEENPHGIDLGPLEPRIPESLRTPSGLVELAAEPLIDDVARLRATLDQPAADGSGLVLIGRRQLRSNNSWMHNVPKLVSGPEGCTLLVNPADAERCGVADGEQAVLRSARGSIKLTAIHSDAMMPGVVSVPHGWGHDGEETEINVASAHPGANVNLLGDTELVDEISGTAVLNGIPVELAAAS
jgi:anaerobic selenocysteine-containing dehydrogenase